MDQQLTKRERRNQMMVKAGILFVIAIFVLSVFASITANMGGS